MARVSLKIPRFSQILSTMQRYDQKNGEEYCSSDEGFIKVFYPFPAKLDNNENNLIRNTFCIVRKSVTWENQAFHSLIFGAGR